MAIWFRYLGREREACARQSGLGIWGERERGMCMAIWFRYLDRERERERGREIKRHALGNLV